MKKLVPLFVVAALLLAFTVPALAGNGDLDWTATKTIFLTEKFDYTETVAFTGKGTFVFDGEAWAKIQEQQELYSLNLQEFSRDIGTTKAADITDSYKNGTGIANVNQAPGNLNNQANEVAISLGSKGTAPGGVTLPADSFEGMYCEAQVVSVQYNGVFFNPATPPGTLGGAREEKPNTYDTGGFTKTDTISASFDTFSGVANVNESAGSLNNQGNAVAIAGGVAEPGHVAQVVVKAASNVMLSQVNAFNTVHEGTGIVTAGNNNTDSINNGSFNSAFGVFNVNQSSGSVNNQKNVVAIAFSGPVARP